MAYTAFSNRLILVRFEGGQGACRPPRPRGPRPWLLKPRNTGRALLAHALFELGPVGTAAEQGVHQELCGRDVAELECCLGRIDTPTNEAARAARGLENPPGASPPGRPGPNIQALGRQPKRWPRPRCTRAL